jgi:hypothetical protein
LETVKFTLPAGKKLTDFTSLVVIANGIPSISTLISPLLVTPITPLPQSIVEGREFDHLEVATFTDPSPGVHTPDQYAATIDWGDGSPATAGWILEDAAGVFHVSGTHTYAEEGTFVITIKVTTTGNTGNILGFATDPFQVIDAPLTAQAAPIAAVEGQGLPVTTILATFEDADSLPFPR